MPGKLVPPGDAADGLTRAGEIVAAAVSDGGIPGAVAAVGRGPATLSTWVSGRADTTQATARPMTAVTIFDLASLTKVVATTTAVLALAGRRQLDLDDRRPATCRSSPPCAKGT